MRCRRYCYSGCFRAIDPRPIVMGAIDYDARDITGHHTLVIPRRAALKLRAGAVKNRDLELVVQGFRCGKGEWPVFRDDQRVAQVVLQLEAVVGKR